ncbi:MAG TPA: YciI family protein [Solimonas sp.]|nr:YciI family protein [Solimonas sp.]
MTRHAAASEYLVISRGQWDVDLPQEEIQDAIDRFYAWHGQLVAEGRMKPGQRLARESRTVSRRGVTDGPFAEAKEVVGGYWFIQAASLDEAAQIASGNPCIACGLSFEIRPIDPEKASAFAVTNETPAAFSSQP